MENRYLKYFQIIVIITVGSLLSIWFFDTLNHQSFDEIKQKFFTKNNDRLFALEKTIQTYTDILNSVTALYAASSTVDRHEFKHFIDKISQQKDYRSFQALEWVPRVTEVSREIFETRARQDGYPDFQITEQAENGRLVRAGNRAEYFPVYYLAPYKGNESLMGYNLASNPDFRQTLEKARDTGRITSSAIVSLTQLQKDNAGVMIFAPVYSNTARLMSVNDRRASLQGYAVGVLALSSLLSNISADEDQGKLWNELDTDFFVYDLNDTQKDKPIYMTESHSDQEIDTLDRLKVLAGNVVERTIEIGDRKWLFVAHPENPDFYFQIPLQNWISLLAGLVITLLASAYFYTLTTRASTVKKLVQTRTDELRASEERWHFALEGSQDGVWDWDATTNRVFFSHQWKAMLGYDDDEISDSLQEWDKRVHPDDKDAVYAILNEHLKGNTPYYQSEHRLKCKDGSYKWILDRGKVIERDESGNPLRVIGTHSDISYRKQAEQELNHFKTTLDETLDCVFMFEPSSLKFFYVNAGAINQVGYSHDELMNMTPFDIKQDYNEKQFRELIKPLLEGRQQSLSFETLHRHKDGHNIPVDIFLQYVNPPGEPARFVAIVRDITERKRIDKMKSEFISTVSHELRTPLTSIRGSLGLINGGITGTLPEKAQEMIKIASNNTERLLLLINDILDIQKIESGQMVFRFQSVELLPFIEKAIRENAAYGEQYNVNFVLTNKPVHGRVFADPDRLMQVMANLLSNAAKFSHENGTVEISVAYHKDALRISVTDHGAGIPEEFHDKIFEKFCQADSSDNRTSGGTGLGLSISKMIIEKHGGHIGFVTNNGIGTTFYLDLPELMGDQVSDKGSPRRLEENETSCILIIEDNQDVAALIKRMLAEAGFNADIACNITQARQLLIDSPHQYKLVTLDIMMPDEDGVSFLEEMRDYTVTRDLPVVIISAIADETRQKLNGHAIGVVDWLQKPFDQASLTASVKKEISLHRPSRILHVEDDDDTHQIVAGILQDTGVVDWARTLSDAKHMLAGITYDLILLDIGLPDGSGLDLLEAIDNCTPPPHVIIFTAEDVREDLASQVHAVLIKSRTDNFRLAEVVNSLIGDQAAPSL